MKTSIGLAVLFILALGGGYYWNQSNSIAPSYTTPSLEATPSSDNTPSSDVTSASNTTPSSDTTSSEAGTYTLAQVASHNTAQDCWVAIDEEVYNLTDWINKHPGGEAAILSLCGKDGTEAFNDIHSASKEANSMLVSFKVGTLTH